MSTPVAVLLSEVQLATLKQLVDTFAPEVARDDDPSGFWARRGSDLGVDAAIAQQLSSGAVPEADVEGIRQLLDALQAQGFDGAPQPVREAILHGFMDSDPGALAGLSGLRALTFLLFYAIPDPTNGKNPNWEAIGYPGPRAVPPSADEAPKTIGITRPSGGELTLTADVVVIGSGSGGGVIAGKLAGAGKDVVVLEAGGYYNESDFNQLELWAYQNLYRAGGLAQTAEGQVALMTGSNLGGGSTVNWTNCLRTYDWVREEWEQTYGLEGLSGAAYDRHLDEVSKRIGVTDQCSDANGPNQRVLDAAAKLGIDGRAITRNADPEKYDADLAGLMGFGDVSGAKLGTLKTYLQDAADAGARFVVNCRADKVLTENGRAAGIEATYVDPETGAPTRVVVRAPQVVVAAGALDTPALLLRSGIGGPAAGDYLRLHPATAVIGVYDETQKAWWGAPQTALSMEYNNLADGYGYLVETSHASPGVTGTSVPWETGEQHKADMARGPQSSAMVFLIRDRGHGRVTIDGAGQPIHTYPFDDAMDLAHFRHGLKTMARMHDAAGASEIITLHRKPQRWLRDGAESLDDYAQRIHDAPLSPFEHATFSLHHMGSARMGTDPKTSVAGPWGELHDTPGVWIGDASAFPTASGTNPMLTTMALAHRTAEAIAAAV
ncbi:FAD-dependent oxidoreductase [Baekduia sp. Peel2402]|uniref:FAD-dependent oxidoreductase n=1 Tax=Baekduia sp. Peel2402 TaxID=3458296 RepID=UPI00403EA431